MTESDFERITDAPDDEGKYTFACRRCSLTVRRTNPNAKGACNCGAKPTLVDRPGSTLKRMLRDELAIEGLGCKSCAALARKMDRLGVAGCLAIRGELVAELRASAKQFGWATKLSATVRSVTSGVAWRLKPWDPYPGLIDEALRRATPRNANR